MGSAISSVTQEEEGTSFSNNRRASLLLLRAPSKRLFDAGEVLSRIDERGR